MLLIIDGIKIKCRHCGHDDFRPLSVPEPKALTCTKCGEQTPAAILLAQVRSQVPHKSRTTENS